MKLCDRCKVPGCCLDYLGKACEKARMDCCPDVQLNNGEFISNMDLYDMAEKLPPMFEALCEDGVPCREYMQRWLEKTWSEDEWQYYS